MRIVEHDAGRLVLRHRTLWISVVCWTAALFIIGSALVHMQPVALIAAGVCIAFGTAFFRTSEVIFDTATRLCTVRRRDTWRTSHEAISFDSIEDVFVETTIAFDSQVPACRLSLLTRRGPIPLSAGFEPDVCRFEHMRSSILHIVFPQGSAPPLADPVRTLLVAGRLVEAVALIRRREGLSLVEAKQRIEELQQEIS